MKSKKLFAVAVICVMPGGIRESVAGQCSLFSPSSMASSMCQDINIEYVACDLGAPRYYQDSDEGECYVVRDCNTCPSGYQRARVSVGLCTNNVQYWSCECVCDDKCESDAGYSAAGAGYEQQTTRSCECYSGSPVCKEYTSYRCAVGYWGTSSNGTSGCTRCPSSGGVYGTTKSAGSRLITACYIPSGSAFGDTSGSGTYTGDCYYKN